MGQSFMGWSDGAWNGQGGTQALREWILIGTPL